MRRRVLTNSTSSPSSSVMPASVPQRSGEATPGGGGTWAAVARNSSPRKPSGVHDASAMIAAGAGHADELGRGARLVGREHRAEDREHGVVLAVLARQRFGVGLGELDVQALGARSRAAAFEQRRNVVRAGHVAAAAGGGDRGVAGPAGHVEHARAGDEVGAVHEALGDDVDQGSDDAEVTAGPHGLLALLDRGEVERLRDDRHWADLRGRGRGGKGRSAERAGARFQRGNNGALAT